jgi:hypothetical protein
MFYSCPQRNPFGQVAKVFFMPRMRILTISEQETFDKPPLFDHRERKQFLYLPKPLIDSATTLRSVK